MADCKLNHLKQFSLEVTHDENLLRRMQQSMLQARGFLPSSNSKEYDK
jgi:hypothetical protein